MEVIKNNNYCYLDEKIQISLTKREFLLLSAAVAKNRIEELQNYFDRHGIKGIKMKDEYGDYLNIAIYENMVQIIKNHIIPDFDEYSYMNKEKT